MHKSRQYCLSRPFLVALAFILVSALGASNESFAQNFTSDNLIVVEIEGLTPHSYGAIVKSFEQNSAAEVVRACVPAQVLLIKRNNGSLTFAQLRSMITGAAPDAGPVSATALDVEGFDERCMNARMGRGQ